jgi:hypothetical protein
MAQDIAQMLDSEIERLDSQLSALRAARAALGGAVRRAAGPKRKRRKLTAAEKAAISKRMKAAWARRKAKASSN